MIPLSVAVVIEVVARRAAVDREDGDENIFGVAAVVENLALSGRWKCDDL